MSVSDPKMIFAILSDSACHSYARLLSA